MFNENTQTLPSKRGGRGVRRKDVIQNYNERYQTLEPNIQEKLDEFEASTGTKAPLPTQTRFKEEVDIQKVVQEIATTPTENPYQDLIKESNKAILREFNNEQVKERSIISEANSYAMGVREMEQEFLRMLETTENNYEAV